MNLRRHQLVAFSLLVAALLLLSCGPGDDATAPLIVTPAVQPSNTIEPPSTTAPRSTDTAQPTATKAPSDTPRPLPSTSPTPTAAATDPVLQPITPANAGQVVLLDRLGTGALQDMTWLPDGHTVVAAYYTGLSLFDTRTLQERQFIPTYGGKARLAAGPDGRHLAMIAGCGVQLWDLSTGQMVQTLAGPSAGAKLIAFGAAGQVLAIAGSEVEGETSTQTVAVWDISGVLDGSAPGGQLLYRLDGFGNGISGLTFSRDGEILVTTKYGNWSDPDDTAYLSLWDAATGLPLPVEGDLSTAPDDLGNLTFSPDGRLLAGSRFSTLFVWEAATGKLLQNLENQSLPNTLAFSADGRWLAAGSSDKLARVWDVPAGELRTTLSGHTGWVTRLAFDPAPSSLTGTTLLATATARDGVQLWDVPSGQRIAAQSPVGHTDVVRAVAYSTDGELLATASMDQTVWLWDADSGRPQGVLDASGLGTGEWCACIFSLAFSPDGETVATGSTDARVRLWDVESGKLLATSEALGDLIFGLGFSPDGRRLAAGDADGAVWVWDLGFPLDSGHLLTLDNAGVVVSLSFNPTLSSAGGRILATGSGFGAIRVWDVDTGTLVREMEGSHNSVRAVYSPDGSVLAAGDSGWAQEFAVRLWDAGSGELRQTLVGHSQDVGGLAFTPDGQILASGDWGGSTRLWDAAAGEELHTLKQGHAVYGVAFRPDGGRLATAGFDGLVWIWGVP